MIARDPRFLGWLLASLRSGLVAVDETAAVVAATDDARRLLGDVEDGDWLGRDCREVLGGQPTVVRLLIEALEGHDRPSRAELALEPVPGGPSTSIGFTLIGVRDEAGRPRGAAMLFRDLTPIERMDEQARLRERLAALGEMASGLAHELRNPLASLELLVGLLERRLVGQPAALELLEELRAELRVLGETVDASLDFVKPAGPSRAFVDARRLLDEALTVARARVPFSGVVERDYAEPLPEVPVDPDQLRTVLVNLVLNALQAMSESGTGGGRLRVSVGLGTAGRASRPQRVERAAFVEPAEPSRELRIEVADDGPGVPEEIRERIFYPFFSTRASGSGIGLALAQKLVASHGGSLDVEEAPGGGALFRIRLPLTEGTT